MDKALLGFQVAWMFSACAAVLATTTFAGPGWGMLAVLGVTAIQAFINWPDDHG